MTLGDLTEKIYVVGVGAQKAGTTWLHTQFALHPQVAMSAQKELHFYNGRHGKPGLRCDEEARRTALARSVGELTAQPELLKDATFCARLDAEFFRARMADAPIMYRQYFQHITTKRHQAFGEITPAYSTLPLEGFRAMRMFHPRTRVIYILRDPVMRQWSAFKQRCRLNGKPPTLEYFDEWVEQVWVRARSDYAGTLDKLETVFEPGEVWVGFFETLFRQQTIDSLCDFIGVERFTPYYDLRENASPVGEEAVPPDIRKASLRATRESYLACLSRFEESIPEAWSTVAAVDSLGGKPGVDLPSAWQQHYRNAPRPSRGDA